jgi:hypothetical protein
VSIPVRRRDANHGTGDAAAFAAMMAGLDRVKYVL